VKERARWCASWIALLVLLVGGAFAADGTATDRQEIEQLLDFVGTSGCDFIRNGIRHHPEDAREHLAMKLSRAGGRVETAEDFVRYVATGSSITGRPYGVACPGKKMIESRLWLITELERLRASRGVAP